MYRRLLACVILSVFCSMAMAADIAFYVGGWNTDGWYDESQFDDVETIIGRTGQLFLDIQQFNDDQFDDFAAWIEANTDDGELDIIWLNGCTPSVLYPFPNLEPDDSRIENWLDGGNMVINVGDWFAYVSYEGGTRSTNNGETGAANILDLGSGIISSADNTSMTVTPTGQQYLPSLTSPVDCDRPVNIAQVQAPWEVAAIFASNTGSDDPGSATQADPIVIHNTETNGYVAIINQASGGQAGWIDDRGLTCAEFIANWVNEVIGLSNKAAAANPQPSADETDVLRDVVLAWTAGQNAGAHNVYFSSEWDDVNATDPGTLIGDAITETSIDVGRLDFGQTYHWRVNEVNVLNPANITIGDVWSFTVEPEGYPVTSITATASTSFPGMTADKTIDGSGLDAADLHSTVASDMWLSSNGDTDPWIQFEFDQAYKVNEMWVWNSNQVVETFIGFGVKDVIIQISTDGTNWTTIEGVAPFAKAPGAGGYAHNSVVDLGGQMAKFVKIDIESGQGTLPQYGLSEVRFFSLPVLARNPQPADGGVADSIDATLTWRAGREADSHEVALSTDQAAVADGSASTTPSTTNSITPGPLNYGTEYFWSVTEVNNVETPAQHVGPVWSFLSPEWLVIDDMEMYEDEEFLEIWAFWADGYEDDNNGSVVGNGNVGETSVVYQGRQSMPIHYDNATASISEVKQSFSPTLNWLKGEPTTLSLQVRGDAPSFVENTDGSITVGGAGADIWGTADDFRFVYKQLNGNGSIVAKIESMDVAHDWSKVGVMIRESLSPESSNAFVCSTGANGTRYQYRLQAFVDSTADDAARDAVQQALAPAPVWVKVERVGDELNGYYAVEETNPTWVPMGENPVTIVMLPEVYVGLAVTSHATTESISATFSNVTTTGGVSGAWATEAIGGTHPDNDMEPMYLVVTDASNNSETVSHPNPNATIMTAWDEWQIDLSSLGSLNLGSIASITIGIGEPGGSPSGDEGTAYIDLIQVGTPWPVVDPNAM